VVFLCSKHAPSFFEFGGRIWMDKAKGNRAISYKDMPRKDE
jgi:hypothetical protein